MSVEFLDGDLLEPTADIDCVVQQCNCLTVSPHGLSASIAEKWPSCDVYRLRKAVPRRNLAVESDRAVPGTAKLLKATNTLQVACLFGQWYPGRIGAPYQKVYPKHILTDSSDQRLKWFVSALEDLGKQLTSTRGHTTVAFPHGIGCGLAGGEWKSYLSAIEEFAKQYQGRITVKIIKKQFF